MKVGYFVVEQSIGYEPTCQASNTSKELAITQIEIESQEIHVLCIRYCLDRVLRDTSGNKLNPLYDHL